MSMEKAKNDNFNFFCIFTNTMSSNDLVGFTDQYFFHHFASYPISYAEYNVSDNADRQLYSKERLEATCKLYNLSGNDLYSLHDFYGNKKGFTSLKEDANAAYKATDNFFDLDLKYQLLFSADTIYSKVESLLFVTKKDLEKVFKKYNHPSHLFPTLCIFLGNKANKDPTFYLEDTKIPDYTIVDILGEGTFGLVFKVQHNKTGEFFAVKSFKSEPDFNEIDILFRLDHPNILRGKSIKMDGIGRLFMILPLAISELSKYQFPNEDVKLAVMYQLASGLHFLHQQKLYHCDLKPANVLLFPSNNPNVPVTACISDFGWTYSQLVNQPICGTPGYASPQGWESHPNQDFFDEPINHVQSDIYSLGAIFYAIYTGKHLNSYKKGLVTEYTKAEDKVLDKFFAATRSEDKFALQLIYSMVRNSQKNRIHSMSDVFNSKLFKSKQFVSPVPGRTKTIPFTLSCSETLMNRPVKDYLKPIIKNLVNSCKVLRTNRHVLCSSFKLICSALDHVSSITMMEELTAVSFYIASECNYQKFGIKFLASAFNIPAENLEHMSYVVTNLCKGILNQPTIFDLAVSKEEVDWYFEKITTDCDLLKTSSDQELHYIYVNEVETDPLARTDKMASL